MKKGALFLIIFNAIFAGVHITRYVALGIDSALFFFAIHVACGVFYLALHGLEQE